MAAAVVERFGGEVPSRLEDLVTLPGVGRKTANVVRSVAFDLPGLPVDTHVGRLSRRLGLTEQSDPVKVELELNRYLPAAERGRFSLRMILHGRRVCFARSPRCGECVLEDICPSSRLPTRKRRRVTGVTADPMRCSRPANPRVTIGVTNQDPATWVAATLGSAAWRRQNDGLVMRPSFAFLAQFAHTIRALIARVRHNRQAVSAASPP